MPLHRRDGSYFGTLCALDPNPSELTEQHFDIFRLLATLISYELESQDDKQKLQEDLTAARELTKERERLIAILSHDLRTPLTAVLLGAQDLARAEGLAPPDQQTAVAIAGSARRATRMVADLLDFTRARLDGGVPIDVAASDLGSITRKVVSEVRKAAPEHEIVVSIEGDCSGVWDADRAAQVVSNLVNNAVQHGPAATSVLVRLRDRKRDVVLEVENATTSISPEDVLQLFSPFRRTARRSAGDGLGLGLFIVRQIMNSHGGTIEVSQDKGHVTFRAVWPR